MRIYLHKGRLCESRAAAGRIFRPAAALNLLCCKSFCMFRFLFAALLKISVICSIYRAIFVGYTIYNFKG